MNIAGVALPSISKVAAALRKTTERLACELAAPTAEPPRWSNFEWHIARAVVAMHGVSTLLCARLRWDGPDSWQRFLREQRDNSVGRHVMIARLLRAIDSQARYEGIPLVGLKGAALNACGIYAIGERPMGDIDLLIRNDDAAATARLLEFCGYSALFTSRRHQVYQPRARKVSAVSRLGEHIDNPIKIEVHTRIAEPLPVLETDITQLLYPRMPHAGLNAYPSRAALMAHLLLHLAGNMRARAVRLIQLHDIALLAAQFGSGDWQELLAMQPDSRELSWAYIPLMLVARYYPAAIPPAMHARRDLEYPWLLGKLARRQLLADVSWSNIRIEAFPGLEWSRSLREAIGFMRSRIWPSHEALMELKEGAAQIPDAAAVPWYGISHGARILRWVFSRPPRVQTLLCVRAALAQEA